VGKLEIDWTRCDRQGLCAALLPDDIILDEWGFPVLRGREMTGDELPEARRRCWRAQPSPSVSTVADSSRSGSSRHHTSDTGGLISD
jgi:ferredoxin